MSREKATSNPARLPPGAPARRVRIDFGPSPIRSSAPPCRIYDSEPKLMRRSVVDIDQS